MSPFPPKSKPWNQRPMDHNGGDQTSQWMDWITTQVNQLVGQANPPAQTGITSLQTNTIDPSSGQIISKGSRVSAVATALTAIPTASGVTFFWDGTNGSTLLRIGRDDGTTVGPTPNGSPQPITGLSPSTQYFFYPWWDEALQTVLFATVPGVSAGSPAYAFAAPNFQASVQQIQRGRIPLGQLFASTGVTTPGVGTGPSVNSSGGSSSGSAGGNRGLLL